MYSYKQHFGESANSFADSWRADNSYYVASARRDVNELIAFLQSSDIYSFFDEMELVIVSDENGNRKAINRLIWCTLLDAFFKYAKEHPSDPACHAFFAASAIDDSNPADITHPYVLEFGGPDNALKVIASYLHYLDDYDLDQAVMNAALSVYTYDANQDAIGEFLLDALDIEARTPSVSSKTTLLWILVATRINFRSWIEKKYLCC